MSGREGDLLNLDSQPGVPALELGDQPADDLPLPAERPETDCLGLGARRTACPGRGKER